MTQKTNNRHVSKDQRFRDGLIRAEKSGDGELRGVIVSEQPVMMYDWGRRGYFNEILLMDGMELPKRGQLPLLDSHSRWSVDDQKGSIRDVQKRKPTKDTPFNHADGRFDFDSTPDSQAVRTKVAEGHVTDISGGYQIDEARSVYVLDGESTTHNGVKYEGPTVLRTWWKLNEGSLTPIGADDEATMRGFRSMADATSNRGNQPANGSGDGVEPGEGRKSGGTDTTPEAERNAHTTITTNTMSTESTPAEATRSTNQPAPTAPIDREAMAREAREQAKKELRERDAQLDGIHKFMTGQGIDQADATEWIRSYRNGGKADTDINQVRAEMQEHPFFKSGGANEPERAAPLDLSEKEAKSWSLVRALHRIGVERKPIDGFEAEISQEIAERSNMDTAGFFVPRADDLMRALPEEQREQMQRDLTVGTATAAGNLVGTDHRGDEFIDFLRPRPLFAELGARVLSGITGGDVQIPRQDGGASAAWKTETTAHAQSELTTDQLTLQPYELGAYAKYTKKALVQSSPDIEMLVRQDFQNALNEAFNTAGFQGSGTNEPTGVINVTGVATSSIATYATTGFPTWAELVEFEEDVETAHALAGSLAYITTNAIKTACKTTLKDSGVAGYQWENNQINGYRAAATTLVPAKTILFGNFADYIWGIWDGVDVVVDPYTEAESRLVKYVVNMMADGNGRHGASWSMSAA